MFHLQRPAYALALTILLQSCGGDSGTTPTTPTGLGLLIGNFIGALLLIYFGGMLVGWLLKALLGEALSWARAEPGEEGYMKRMWVTHSLPFFVAVLGSALPSLIVAGVLLFRHNKTHQDRRTRLEDGN